MWKSIVHRLLWAVPTLLGITLITFFVTHLAPGDPGTAGAGAVDSGITQIERDRLSRHYGWDRPLAVQYFDWLGDALRLDFGRSFSDGQPVAQKIARAFPPTLYLGAAALALSLLVSIPIGVLSARKPRGTFDSASGIVLSVAYSVPSYVFAVLLIRFVGVEWDLLPFRGVASDGFESMTGPQKLADLGAHLFPVALCLAYRPAAYQARFLRGQLIEASRADFFRTARAKGRSNIGALIRHGLPNTLIPMITLVALSLPTFLSGAVILEVIFSWPGLGRLMVDAALQRDYPTVMAVSMFSAVLVLGATLIADLAYLRADPRVTYD